MPRRVTRALTRPNAPTPTTGGTGGTGTATPAPTGTGTATSTPAPAGTPNATALAAALKDAEAAYAEGEAALKAGNFAAYGTAQTKLKDALKRAVEASPQGSPTTKAP